MSRLPLRPARTPASGGLRAGIALAALLLGVSCTSDKGMKSSGSPTDDSGVAGESQEPSFVGPPSRLTWTLYKTGQQIALVNESDTDRLEFYSERRNSASTKVQTDEIVAALIEFFEDEDFDDYSQPGSAPAAGVGQASQALEIEVDGRRSYMLWAVDRPTKERASFVACRDGLMEIWNATYAAQAVDNPKGEGVFGTSAQSGKTR